MNHPSPSLSIDLEKLPDLSNARKWYQEKVAVFTTICLQPGISRKKIIAKLKMRPTSVSHLVQELLDVSLVHEKDRILQKSSGRPEVALYPVKNRFLAISFHIVAYTIKVALLNPFEEVIFTGERSLPPETSPSVFLNTLSELVEQAKQSVPEGSTLLGASIHLPGFMDTAKEVWIFAARWPKIRNLSFEKIRSAVGVPCSIDRMLDAALEYLLLREPEIQGKDILLVHWGYGIGAAFAYRGQVLASNIGGVCEIGHWKVVEEGGMPCMCGSHGCLETVSSLWALLPFLKEAYREIPEVEDEFAGFLSQQGEIIESPVFQKALWSMGSVLGALFTTLFPNIIYLYGPFGTIPSIQQALQDITLQHIPQFARSYLDLRFLPPQFYGDRFGGSRTLFQKAYREILLNSSKGKGSP